MPYLLSHIRMAYSLLQEEHRFQYWSEQEANFSEF